MKKLVISSYFCLLFIFVLFSYLFLDYHLPFLFPSLLDFSNQNRALVASMYLIFLLFSFAYYALFLIWSRKKILSSKDLKLLIVGSIVILIFSYPATLSYDIFNYLSTSKTLFFYHENPYIIMPIEFVGEPFLSFTRASNKLALYGPSWILLTGIPFYLLGFNVWLLLLGVKILVTVFYVWLSILVYKITKSQFVVVFFALNPLVMYETLVSSHNDVVMISFCIFSFWSLQNKKMVASLATLVLSIFIKYTTVLLVPVWLLISFFSFTKRKINWNKIYMISAGIMFAAFLLSPLREEMYPWYAIWFLPFIALGSYKKWLVVFCFLLSLGLMLRYLPFMYTGMYFGSTPFLREFVTLLPLLFFPVILVYLRKR